MHEGCQVVFDVFHMSPAIVHHLPLLHQDDDTDGGLGDNESSMCHTVYPQADNLRPEKDILCEDGLA